MKMLPISKFSDMITGKVLVLNPRYPIGHKNRIMIVDPQSVKFMDSITHFLPLHALEPTM